MLCNICAANLKKAQKTNMAFTTLIEWLCVYLNTEDGIEECERRNFDLSRIVMDGHGFR